MSKGGNQQSTQQTSVPDWAVPYAVDYMKQGSELGNSPYQAYTGQRYTGNNAYQNQGIEQQAGFAQNNQVNSAANNQLTSTIQGDYLNNNPYLQQNIDRSSADVVRNYNLAVRPQMDAMDARSGSFGNSGVAQTQQEQQRQLGETLAGVSTTMRSQDYTNERNRQLAATGQAPAASAATYNDSQQLYNAGAAANQPQQQNLDFQYQQHLDQQSDPYKKLTATGAPFGANMGSNVTQSQPGASSSSQWLGGGLAGAGMLGSLYGNGGGGKG